MHIKKPKQLMLISGVVLMLLVFIFVILLRSQTTQEPPISETLIERPDMSQENWSRVLQQTETSEDKKEVVNLYDGYKITMPADWQTIDQSQTLNATQISFYPGEVMQHIANALNIEPQNLSDLDLLETPSILTISSQLKSSSLSLTEWIKQHRGLFHPEAREFSLVRVNGHTAYKTSAVKLIEDEGVVENSLQVSYVLQNKRGDKAYILKCTAIGESFLEQRRECEESIQTFELI